MLAALDVNAAKESFDTFDKQLKLNQRRYDEGTINGLDLSRVLQAQMEALQAVDQAESAQKQAMASLLFLLGARDAIQNVTLTTGIEYLGLSQLKDASLPSLHDLALRNRTDVKIAEANLEQSQVMVRQARRARVPDIALSLGYSEQCNSDTCSSVPTFNAGLQGNVPVFYLQQGEIKRAESNALAAQRTLDKAKAQVLSDVTQAYAGFVAGKSQVERMEGKLLEQAKLSRDLAQHMYQKGAASLIDFLDAQHRTWPARSSTTKTSPTTGVRCTSLNKQRRPHYADELERNPMTIEIEMKKHEMVTPWLVVASAVLWASACNRSEAEELSYRTPPDEMWLSREQMAKGNIRIAEAMEQDLPQIITVGGRIAFNDMLIQHVFSPVTGRITRVLAQPGQRLKKGAPLLALISPDIGQAFSDVVKAQADVVATEADFHRQERLAKEGAAAQRDYEQSEDNYRRAKAEYDRAQKKAFMLRTGSLDTVTQEFTLRSYMSGKVIARMANPGVEVQGQYSGGAANELFTIGDIGEVWAFADVQDFDLPDIKLGSNVDVQVIAYPGRVFHGKVDWISGAVDPVLRTARIRCVLPNPDEKLKPEMFATLFIERRPRTALGRTPQRCGPHQRVFLCLCHGRDETRRADDLQTPTGASRPGTRRSDSDSSAVCKPASAW